MKTLFIFLISITTVSVFSSFKAEGTKEVQPVNCGSKTLVKRLSEVRFTASGDVVKAINTSDKSTAVLYTADGELVETHKAISAEELPAAIIAEMEKKYDSYKIKKVVRFERANETGFYVYAENNKKAITLEATETGSLTEKQ